MKSIAETVISQVIELTYYFVTYDMVTIRQTIITVHFIRFKF